MFSRAWAERLKVQLPVMRLAAERLREVDRQIEFGEVFGPSERDYEQAFRALWSECVLTVWIADGLHRWLVRLARELGEEVPGEIEHLRQLRNALVHLDEAALEEEGAYAGESGNRSLRELPGSRLLVRSWEPGSPLFDLLDVEKIEGLSVDLLGRLERELDELAEDYVVQAEIDRLRGK